IVVFNNRKQQFAGENGKKIKQSISRAINKKRIIDRLFLGKAVETSIPVNLNTINFYGLKSDTYYNAEKARELLQEVGYVNLNSMGLLENENGETINVEIKTNHSNNYKRIAADFIVQDLRAIGINAYSNFSIQSIESMNSEQVEKEKSKFRNDLETGDFDIALITVNLTDVVDIGSLLHTNSIGVGMNYSNYSNYNLDVLLEKLKLNSEYDIARENYLSAIEIYTEDMPIVPLYIKTNALLVDETLQGEINPIQSDIYRKFRNMFILKQFQ
ncbi:MAG: ABC transporter substrate-binding protein, partial [Neofamilia sp.]